MTDACCLDFDLDLHCENLKGKYSLFSKFEAVQYKCSVKFEMPGGLFYYEETFSLCR